MSTFRVNKNVNYTVMAAVGDNIRTLHSRLAERGADCTLEWNSGGHFKDADLRTAKAFRWGDGRTRMTILIDADSPAG